MTAATRGRQPESGAAEPATEEPATYPLPGELGASRELGPRPFVAFLPEHATAVHVAQPLWLGVRFTAYVLACEREGARGIPVQWGEMVPDAPTCSRCIEYARKNGLRVSRVKIRRAEP